MSSDCFFGISCIIHTVPRLEGSLPDTTFGNYGCVRLASLGRARCVAVLSSRTNVGNYLHTFVLGKKTATHRVRPRESKRTHPIGKGILEHGRSSSRFDGNTNLEYPSTANIIPSPITDGNLSNDVIS